MHYCTCVNTKVTEDPGHCIDYNRGAYAKYEDVINASMDLI